MAAEAKLELALRVWAIKQGGLCLKFVSPGHNGVPDRIIIMPGGKVSFVELKAPGCKPRPLQEHTLAKLRALGCTAIWGDSLEGIITQLDNETKTHNQKD
jgi:hypothetical protein